MKDFQLAKQKNSSFFVWVEGGGHLPLVILDAHFCLSNNNNHQPTNPAMQERSIFPASARTPDQRGGNPVSDARSPVDGIRGVIHKVRDDRVLLVGWPLYLGEWGPCGALRPLPEVFSA